MANVALFLATVPPARYLVTACDTLSLVQVVTATLGGLGLALLVAAPGLPSIPRRVAGTGALTAVLAATIALGFPACLGDPYGNLDPRLTTLWLANVSEARSFFSVMHDLPGEAPAYYGLPVAGLIFGVIRCARDGEARWGWLTCTAVLTTLCLLAAWELRVERGGECAGRGDGPGGAHSRPPRPGPRARVFWHRPSRPSRCACAPIRLR